MIDGQSATTNVQRTVKDHRRAFGHHTLVIGLVLARFEGVAHGALDHAFADHVFAFCVKGAQVAVVATLQQSLTITHIDRVRCAVDQ
ncbi:hypothetical protein D3C80_1609050 [compost metagenome]